MKSQNSAKVYKSWDPGTYLLKFYIIVSILSLVSITGLFLNLLDMLVMVDSGFLVTTGSGTPQMKWVERVILIS